ncbi:MAG TPA: hypothetical protein VM784_08465 [Actinomycetota bacterium]|nr:hypothetical protein [Actinomycetota bacterium]
MRTRRPLVRWPRPARVRRRHPAASCENVPAAVECKESDLNNPGSGYTPEQGARLRQIHARLIEARRELDALIGDAYLRPRASIVPVHFLDLASAVEKLRWAEKEWRELDRELEAADPGDPIVSSGDEDDEEPSPIDLAEAGVARRR